MKKIIALLFSFCFIFGISLNVAAYSDIESGTIVSEAVELLSDLDIVNGFENGTFKPEQNVTRAEMAKLIYEMLNLKTSSTFQSFDDVTSKHWAFNYINVISMLGIINGYGDGNYGPDDIVTYEQAIKMVVCALGYEPVASSKGGYPNGYIIVANSLGLLENVDSSQRGDIAVLLYNALEVPFMKQVSFGTSPSYESLDGTGNREYKTVLTNKGIYKITGIVENNYDSNKINVTVTKDSLDGKFAKNDVLKLLIGDSAITDYIYQKVTMYIAAQDDSYTIVSILSTLKAESFSLMSDDIVSIDTKKNTIKYSVDDSYTKTLSVDEDAIIEFNGNSDTVDSIEFFEGKEDIELIFIDNDGDLSYDAIVAVLYTSEILAKVDASKNRIALNGKTIELGDDIAYDLVDKNGKTIKLSKFKENDVIAYYCDDYYLDGDSVINSPNSANYIRIMLLNNSTITGTVTSVSSSEKTVTINKKDYKVADSIWDEVGTLNASGTYYLSITNKIFAFDSSTAQSNYAYILRTGRDFSDLDDVLIVELLTANGVKKYKITSSVENTLEDYFEDNYDNLEWDGILDANRFVTYKVNTSGKLSKIETVIENFSKELDENTYNGNAESIKNSYVDANTLIFVLTEEESEDNYATTMNYLIHDGTYSGALYNKNGVVKVMFITETDTRFNLNTSFAIVTAVSTKTVDDEDVLAISYTLNDIKGTLYFEDTDEDTFSIGTVFAFNENGNHYATKYTIIADVIDNEDFQLNEDYEDDNVEIYVGYIFNENKRTNSKGEIISFSYDGVNEDDVFAITSIAHKYTYRKLSKKYTITVGDFLAANATYMESEEDKNIVTPVIIRVVDDIVTDIYSISSRLEKEN